MAINTKILFVMAASIAVFGDIHPISAVYRKGGRGNYVKVIRETDNEDDGGSKVNVKDILGHWFTVAMISPLLAHLDISCDRRTVRKGGDDESFKVIDSTVASGLLHTYKGNGRIENSTIYVKYPKLSAGEDVNSIEVCNGGKELILHNRKNATYYILHSRTLNASEEAIGKFEKYAADAHLQVTYINQHNCS